MTTARIGLLLALADDELIFGHRLSEWTGWVPYIEEDLALSSIAQDEIAHARALYEICAALDGRDADALALGRAPDEYRNAILCERPNRDFAYTIARHWLYDLAADVRLASLETSTFKELREVAAIFRLEERYHLEHANTWFERLANGPVEARRLFGTALTDAFGEAHALFELFEDEAELLADATLPDKSETLKNEWRARARSALTDVGLDHVDASGEMIPTSSGEIEASVDAHAPDGTGGRYGKHSDDFGPLWEEMTALYRAHPGARW